MKKFREIGVVREAFNMSLKILPRFHGMALDMNMKEKATENVIFFHGVKKHEDLFKLWNYKEASYGQQKLFPHCRTKL